MKVFIWNILLAISIWYKIKFKTHRIKSFRKWDNKREGWQLTFSDEFNDYKLDRTKWRTDTYYNMRFHPGNIIDENRAPDFYYDDDSFTFSADAINIRAIDTPKKITYEGKEFTIPYRVGQIDSSGYFMQTKGYFEIRARMPNSPSMWPQFWLASIMTWPLDINIYKIYTGGKGIIGKMQTSVKWAIGNKTKYRPKGHMLFDLSQKYYTYGCEWTDKYLKFYFQDELIRVMKTPKSFIHPMHIVINSGIDLENKESAEFPNYYEVDYVRAYTKKDI